VALNLRVPYKEWIFFAHFNIDSLLEGPWWLSLGHLDLLTSTPKTYTAETYRRTCVPAKIRNMRGFVLLLFRCCTSFRNVYRHHERSFWTRALNLAIGTLCNYFFFCLFLLYDIHVTLRNLVYVCMAFLIDFSRKNLKVKLHIVNRCVCKTVWHISKKFIFGFCTQKFWSSFMSLVSAFYDVVVEHIHFFVIVTFLSRWQRKFVEGYYTRILCPLHFSWLRSWNAGVNTPDLFRFAQFLRSITCFPLPS